MRWAIPLSTAPNFKLRHYPIERIFLISEPDFPEHYTVVEGNRRATVLILLANPALIETLEVFGSSAELRRLQIRFRDFAASFDRKKIEPIKAVLAPSREETVHWVQMRHTGEGEGVGVTRWRSIEAARFSDPTQPMVLLADLLFQEGDLSDVEKELFDDFPWTTLYRFFDSPRLLEKLCMGFRDGRVVTSAPRSRVIVAVREIAFRVARGDYNSRLQNTVEDRIGALDELPEGILPQRPTSREQGVGGEHGSGSADGTATPGTKPRPAAESTGAAPSISKKTRSQSPSDRLFRKSEFNVTDKRVFGVFQELCEHAVSKKPNTCGVMLRVFLEMSLVEYLKRKGEGVSASGGRQAELHLLVEKAYKRLMKDDPQLELPQIEAMILSRTAQVRMRVLHGYVHSRHEFPAPADLKAVAGELTPFLKAMWS